MTSTELQSLEELLAKLTSHHDQDSICPGPSHCTLAAGICDLSLMIGSARLQSGFDNPERPEATYPPHTESNPITGPLTKDPKTGEDLPRAATFNPNLWLHNNRAWLQKWITDRLVVDNDADAKREQSQWFFSRMEVYGRSGELKDARRMITEDHSTALITALVFGQSMRARDAKEHEDQWGTPAPIYIDGFMSQKGRLPTEHDHIQIHVGQHEPIGHPTQTNQVTHDLLSYQWQVISLEILEPAPKKLSITAAFNDEPVPIPGLLSTADARVWAEEFRKTAIDLGYSDMDEGWLIGWFANAMMVMHDLHGRPNERIYQAEAAGCTIETGSSGGIPTPINPPPAFIGIGHPCDEAGPTEETLRAISAARDNQNAR